MRPSVLLIAACVALLGCGKAPDEAGPAPKSAASAASATSAASAASEAPKTVPTTPPAASKVEALLADAVKTCVKDTRVRRTCTAFKTLRTALEGKRDDAAWWGRMLLVAKGDPAKAPTQVALTLLADGGIQGPSVDFVPAARPMLDSPHAVARAASLRALSTHADPALVPRALALLESDTDASVREAAAYLLGRPINHGERAKTEPALLSALVNDKDTAVKRAAIGALGKLKPKKAVKPLISVLDDAQLGPNAAVQLGGFDDPDAFRAILSGIAKAKAGTAVSPSLFAALGRMRQAKAFNVDEVKAVLTDVRPALAKIGHPNAKVGVRMLDRLLSQLAPAGKPTP